MPLRLNRSTSLTTSFSRKTNGSGRLSSGRHCPNTRFQCLLSGSLKRLVIVQTGNRRGALLRARLISQVSHWCGVSARARLVELAARETRSDRRAPGRDGYSGPVTHPAAAKRRVSGAAMRSLLPPPRAPPRPRRRTERTPARARPVRAAGGTNSTDRNIFLDTKHMSAYK
jgi:hypothetical protein